MDGGGGLGSLSSTGYCNTISLVCDRERVESDHPTAQHSQVGALANVVMVNTIMWISNSMRFLFSYFEWWGTCATFTLPGFQMNSGDPETFHEPC